LTPGHRHEIGQSLSYRLRFAGRRQNHPIPPQIYPVRAVPERGDVVHRQGGGRRPPVELQNSASTSKVCLTFLGVFAQCREGEPDGALQEAVGSADLGDGPPDGGLHLGHADPAVAVGID
jgi:hypothetical protein